MEAVHREWKVAVMQKMVRMRVIVFAGAAVVAAGAFVGALSEEMTTHDGPTMVTSMSGMDVGDTATKTAEPPTTIPTPVASPVLKASKPCGFDSGC